MAKARGRGQFEPRRRRRHLPAVIFLGVFYIFAGLIIVVAPAKLSRASRPAIYRRDSAGRTRRRVSPAVCTLLWRENSRRPNTSCIVDRFSGKPGRWAGAGRGIVWSSAPKSACPSRALPLCRGSRAAGARPAPHQAGRARLQARPTPLREILASFGKGWNRAVPFM